MFKTLPVFFSVFTRGYALALTSVRDNVYANESLTVQKRGKLLIN